MTAEFDIFSQINNSILDLQASQLQSFERPLKSLGRLLKHPSLEEINRTLTIDLNLDSFISASAQTGGSMVGSQQLLWPENDKQVLGLTLLLIEKFADNPDYAINFSHDFFYSGSSISSGIHSLIRQLIIPFARDYKTYVLNSGNTEPKLQMPQSKEIFIVHGHDGEARESVARFLGSIGFVPIILHEQANRGRTIIEKVEAHGNVGFAVVLLTPDDEGKSKSATELEPRARQNVLLELGYFIGRLGREKVCALKKGEVEIPSDFAGIVWAPMDSGNGWKQILGRELEAAGHNINWNDVMRS